MIDIDKYDGHTTTHWSTRNQGTACDDNPDYFDPYLETNGGNIAIGYFDAGSELHSLEEKRANMRLMADAHLILEAYKELREQGRKLVEAAERVRSDISDQDTGWYYQLGNHIEKMNRLVSE